MSGKKRIDGRAAKGQYALLTDYQYHRLQREKREERTRNVGVLICVSIIMVVLLLVNSEFPGFPVGYFSSWPYSQYATTIGLGVVITAATAKIFFTYLAVEKPESVGKSELERMLARSIGESADREDSARNQEAKRDHVSVDSNNRDDDLSMLEKKDKDEIFSTIKNKIEASSFKEYREHLFLDVARSYSLDKIDEVVNNTVSRVENEIYSLGRRANVNLFIGIVVSAVGLVYMGLVLRDTAHTDFNLDSLANFVPKFSFVVLVEVFAYFFLRIYKGAQAEIKYFQNEISNVELKYLSILLVNTGTADVESFRSTVSSLASTERNFILEKGQSTASLEEVKQEGLERQSLINAMLKLAGNKRSI